MSYKHGIQSKEIINTQKSNLEDTIQARGLYPHIKKHLTFYIESPARTRVCVRQRKVSLCKI